MRPYICYDCTKITTAGATTEDWIALGYVIPDNKGSWKYISKLGYSADDPEVRYPVEVNASSSNGYADGCYTAVSYTHLKPARCIYEYRATGNY